MPLPIPTVPLVVIISASGVALLIFMVHCLPIVFVRVERGINDTEEAKTNFLRILHATRSELLIYDDGDASDCSLYQDKELVDEVHRFLKESSIKMRCLFTFDEKLLLTQTLTPSDGINFDVRVANQTVRDDRHYKISDSGNMLYLTRHKKGACERPFSLIDCSGVPKLVRWHVKKRLAKDHLDSFNLGFNRGRKTVHHSA